MAENPYPYNNPVSDPARFAGRRDALAFVVNNLVGGHQQSILSVFGASQMGKSSLLRQLPHHLDERYCPVRLSLRAGTVAGEQAWLSALAGTIPDALAILNIQSARLPELPARAPDLRSALLGSYLTEGLHALRKDRHLLILVDNAERLLTATEQGALPPDTFALLGHLLSKHSHLDILMAFDAGCETDVMALGAPFDPALTCRLGPLTPPEMAELLTKPAKGIVTYDYTALEAIDDLTAGHPHLGQVMGWLLFELSEARGHTEPIQAEDVEAVTDRALVMAGDTLGEIWTNGTPQEQAVLQALSALSSGEPPAPVPHDAISQRVIAAGRPLDQRTINAVLRRLEYEGVTRLTADGLILAGGLRRRWLRVHAAEPPTIQADARPPLPSRRGWIVAAAVVIALILLLAFLSALPGPEQPPVSGEATVTLDLNLQATRDSYFATETAVAE